MITEVERKQNYFWENVTKGRAILQATFAVPLNLFGKESDPQIVGCRQLRS